ncbi:hypothetical protein [Fischerella thermalis]|uniref:hypothetical protein n=1 Tax=Fischerella thermalis TaxID=372787 RepID=UPI0011AF1872|nr:hypothetical protein [Fischerella thermalis]
MNLQFTGMTRRRDVALLRLYYVWSMIWHRTTKMYAHIIHDQIQQRLLKLRKNSQIPLPLCTLHLGAFYFI